MLNQTTDHRHRVLAAAAKHLRTWFIKVKKMKAMGWRSQLDVSPDTVAYSLKNALDVAIAADTVSAAFRRPVEDESDRIIDLQRTADGSYAAAHDLAAGQWIVTVTAIRQGEPIYSDVLRILVSEAGSGG